MALIPECLRNVKSFICDECRYAECRHAECHYAECHYAECRGASMCTTMSTV